MPLQHCRTVWRLRPLYEPQGEDINNHTDCHWVHQLLLLESSLSVLYDWWSAWVCVFKAQDLCMVTQLWLWRRCLWEGSRVTCVERTSQPATSSPSLWQRESLRTHNPFFKRLDTLLQTRFMCGEWNPISLSPLPLSLTDLTVVSHLSEQLHWYGVMVLVLYVRGDESLFGSARQSSPSLEFH